MSVIPVSFPSHQPVRVTPDGFGGWLVTWRKYGELVASREQAISEAWRIAAEHRVQVIAAETFLSREAPHDQ